MYKRTFDPVTRLRLVGRKETFGYNGLPSRVGASSFLRLVNIDTRTSPGTSLSTVRTLSLKSTMVQVRDTGGLFDVAIVVSARRVANNAAKYAPTLWDTLVKS